MRGLSFSKIFIGAVVSFFIAWSFLSLVSWWETLKTVKVSKDSPFSFKASFSEPPCSPTSLPDGLYIPRLKVAGARIIYPEKGATLDDYLKLLSQGVVHYPYSSLPGEKGNTILLGHSAAPFYLTDNPYLKIFSELNILEEGDEIKVVKEGCEYRYAVFKKDIYEKGEEIRISFPESNFLILISCWPPGRNLMRLVVFATPLTGN